ncbi:MAG: ABC transporter permease [Saprospiraceae bacterium]|nr:ABC transporter permease [Saprospiraceae bacterium]
MKKRLHPAYWVLGLLLLVAVGRDFLANGRPLYCRVEGEGFWPGVRTMWKGPNAPFAHPVLDSIRRNELWKTYPYKAAVFAPIPFSPGEKAMPYFSANELPARPGTIHPQLSSRFRHWLGTDREGRDVAAALVAGARVAVLTGLTAMTMAMSIGLFLGALAGFWGDDRLRLRRGTLWLTLLGLLPAWFYAFVARQYVLSTAEGTGEWVMSGAIFVGVLLLFRIVGWLLSRFPFFGRVVTVPADLLIMRLSELFNAIPKLIFLFVMVAVLPRGNESFWVLIALIGAMSWTGVARFVRADLLRVRELDYVTAARGLGLSEARILWRHALPNAIRATMIAFAFGVAGAVLLEASLSFLGLGSTSNASWGALLNNARSSLKAWWMALPSGLAICLTVLALNAIGERLSENK